MGFDVHPTTAKFPRVSKTENMKNGANGSNGTETKKQGENVMSLEMESLHPEHTAVRYPQKLGICDQLFLLVRLYAESYPRVASAVGFATFLFCLYAAVVYSKPPMQRNPLEHQYQDLDRDYTSKLSQMDHWCLFVSLHEGRCAMQCPTMSFFSP